MATTDPVADPAGGPLRAYADTVAILDHLVTRLTGLGWAHAEPHPLPLRRALGPLLRRDGQGGVAGGPVGPGGQDLA